MMLTLVALATQAGAELGDRMRYSLSRALVSLEASLTDITRATLRPRSSVASPRCRRPGEAHRIRIRWFASAAQKKCYLDKEDLAFVYGTEHSHQYLWRRSFGVVITHNQLLCPLAFDKGIPLYGSPANIRWALKLAAYMYCHLRIYVSLFTSVGGSQFMQTP